MPIEAINDKEENPASRENLDAEDDTSALTNLSLTNLSKMKWL